MAPPETPELPELIDSHCHLDYDYAPKGVDEIVAEASLAGVRTLITIGTEPASLARTVEISERFANVYHTAGYHPHEAVAVSEEDLATLARAALHPKCRAIGEIGLDYHYDHSPREIQRSRLSDQLRIARETGQPVVIHSRDAEADLLAALSAHCALLPPMAPMPEEAPPGVIHCFSGTAEFGHACLELGFYLSFSGILTFKNADALRAFAREVPLERLLVETDSPYLAPIPHRGKKCEPAMTRLTALKLAEIQGVAFEEVARATTANARRLFRIGRAISER